MNQQKEERHEEAAPGRGQTVTAQGENQAPKARQPHEHDESADSQASESESIDRMGDLAHASAERGEQDTTRGKETDATYHRLRESSEPAPPAGKPERDPR